MSTQDAKNGKWKEAGALEVLTLGLDGHIFALEAAYVREILDLGPVTEVPSASPFVNGLINVRGKVVPLADLRRKFGMEQRATTIDTRVVVIEIDLGGDQTTIGTRSPYIQVTAWLERGSFGVSDSDSCG